MSSRSALQLDSRVQRARHIIFSKLDDEWLAIDSESGFCYSMNITAGQVWELIGEPVMLAAVCDELIRRYAVDKDTCEGDVLALVQEMAALGVVKVVADTPYP